MSVLAVSRPSGYAPAMLSSRIALAAAVVLTAAPAVADDKPRRYKPQTCQSSIFAQRGDKLAGGKSRYLGRRVKPTDHGIAHRWWPLGARVKITNLRTGKSTVGVVLDRGPYGKLDAVTGEWFNGARDRKRKGKWRGCADLTPSVAAAIDHDGWDRVMISVVVERLPES